MREEDSTRSKTSADEEGEKGNIDFSLFPTVLLFSVNRRDVFAAGENKVRERDIETKFLCVFSLCSVDYFSFRLILFSFLEREGEKRSKRSKKRGKERTKSENSSAQMHHRFFWLQQEIRVVVVHDHVSCSWDWRERPLHYLHCMKSLVSLVKRFYHSCFSSEEEYEKACKDRDSKLMPFVSLFL